MALSNGAEHIVVARVEREGGSLEGLEELGTQVLGFKGPRAHLDAVEDARE